MFEVVLLNQYKYVVFDLIFTLHFRTGERNNQFQYHSRIDSISSEWRCLLVNCSRRLSVFSTCSPIYECGSHFNGCWVLHQLENEFNTNDSDRISFLCITLLVIRVRDCFETPDVSLVSD